MIDGVSPQYGPLLGVLAARKADALWLEVPDQVSHRLMEALHVQDNILIAVGHPESLARFRRQLKEAELRLNHGYCQVALHCPEDAAMGGRYKGLTTTTYVCGVWTWKVPYPHKGYIVSDIGYHATVAAVHRSVYRFHFLPHSQFFHLHTPTLNASLCLFVSPCFHAHLKQADHWSGCFSKHPYAFALFTQLHAPSHSIPHSSFLVLFSHCDSPARHFHLMISSPSPCPLAH
jgi:hypothetical protein